MIMKRNVSATFVSYVIISIICLVTGGFLYSYLFEYYGMHIYFWFAVSIAHFLAIFLLYFLAGRHFINPNYYNKKSEFASIWLLSTILFLVSIFAVFSYQLGSYEEMGVLTYVNPLVFCSGFFSGIFNIIKEPKDEYFVLSVSSILCSIVPSLFLWLGMLSKKKRSTIKQGRQESKELE